MNLSGILMLIILSCMGISAVVIPQQKTNIASYSVDPKTAHLEMFWKDQNDQILGSFQKLRSFVENKGAHLLFAMNGGMYKPDHSPQGLFIQDNVIITPLDTASGKGNFYIKPNGVFYLDNRGKAGICKTESLTQDRGIAYATQSGPMLICNGEVNSAFKKGSQNLNIRNGVGILPDGKVIFAISEGKVNFYDFAMFFKEKGCKNALYLDGFVSRMYMPMHEWQHEDGDFGVIIAVTDK